MRLNIYSSIILVFGAISSHCWPNAPLVTSGRWIHNANGQNVTYAGVNWPGAADVMIPEGLQYSSIASIVAGIKSLGMNAIRLTFAIEMIDDKRSIWPTVGADGPEYKDNRRIKIETHG